MIMFYFGENQLIVQGRWVKEGRVRIGPYLGFDVPMTSWTVFFEMMGHVTKLEILHCRAHMVIVG